MDTLRRQVSGQAAPTTMPIAAPAPAAPAAPPPLAPGSRAKVGANGLAIAPASAPLAVQQIIAAGNQIAKTPYIYGGGHASWNDRGYDCSGSVSYALHGAGLLDAPRPSSGFYNWGLAGPGQWVTIYTKASHIYMVVAGLRFDTSGRSIAGTRWQAAMRDPSGYVVRHPEGL
jgi:cell wall-associated NlpC family hydrolase